MLLFILNSTKKPYIVQYTVYNAHDSIIMVKRQVKNDGEFGKVGII